MFQSVSKMVLKKKRTSLRTNKLISVNRKYFHESHHQKKSAKVELISTWRKFCENTKLAGLHIIGGHREMSMDKRIILFSIWIIGFALSVYKVDYCLNVFLNHEIRTAVTYDKMNELQFPAITLCHVIGIRKSVVGMNEDLTKLMSYMLIRDVDELRTLKEQNWKTCRIRNTTKSSKKAGQNMKNFIIGTALMEDFEKFFQTLAVDSTMSVNKCWWNSRETNCSDLFLNHQLKNDICFTFNQNPKYINFNKASLGVAVYGAKGNKEKTAISYGPSNGLKLLLDVHQEEHCLSLVERFGSGFRVFVHDAKSQSNYDVDSSINISPGFDYTITLKPITYDRRNFTESLGHCTSFVYNFLKPDQKEYNQESCFASCFAESVFRKCNCLAVERTSKILTIPTANYLGLANNKSLKTCYMLLEEERECFADQMIYFYAQNPEAFCPKCQRSCLETNYDYQLSGKKLSRSQIKLISDIYQTNKSVEKNYLLVSFMFEDKNLVTVREIQAFTSLNFYMAIGGILGLFLGFSTVSLYEIVHYSLISVSVLRRRLFRDRSRRKSRINPTVIFNIQGIRNKDSNFRYFRSNTLRLPKM